MLNLLMTESPRLAAMLANKPLGEDAVTNHALRHRAAWLRWKRENRPSTSERVIEGGLRERTA